MTEKRDFRLYLLYLARALKYVCHEETHKKEILDALTQVKNEKDIQWVLENLNHSHCNNVKRLIIESSKHETNNMDGIRKKSQHNLLEL